METRDAMLSQLQARVQQYRDTRATLTTSTELATALQSPNWETRCAAVEQLQADSPLNLLEQALHDDDHSVRLTAIGALRRMQEVAPVTLWEQLINDSHWQVRELATLTCAELHIQVPVPPTTHIDTLSPANKVTQPVLPFTSKTRRQRTLPAWKIALLAATFLFFFGALPVAAISLGWWQPALGNPAQYTTINQEQTQNGLTVRVINIYMDQGRTVLVYDVLNTSNKQFGSLPQVNSAYPQDTQNIKGGGGYSDIDKENTHLRHHYTVFDPFIVPTNVDKLDLTVTFKLNEIIEVSEADLQKNPEEAKRKAIEDAEKITFTFNITAPFHHTNNQNIVYPFGYGA